MAETESKPMLPKQTQLAALALANLFLYSVAMFTLPFIAFFGVRHVLSEYYPVDAGIRNIWSVIAAVVVVNMIICMYAYKAYHEKEYDEEGKEIDPRTYQYGPTENTETNRSDLNLKQD